MAIPSRPAAAAVDVDADSFRICAEELLDSGIPPEQASTACGSALDPEDLSLCVLGIDSNTLVAAEDALEACFQVRRPLELASCVVNINNETSNPDLTSVLNNCRRSLLPERFSDCVVGLSSGIDFSPAEAMETCISAEDFPRELFPTSVSPSDSSPTYELEDNPTSEPEDNSEQPPTD